MKFFVVALVFIGLVAPVFGQDANVPLYRSLDDSMGTTISSSSDMLQSFDRDITYNNQGKTYATYKLKYDALNKALQDSELRLYRLIQFHDTATNIKAERDQYESLIKQLEQVKSEYDSWLRNVQ